MPFDFASVSNAVLDLFEKDRRRSPFFQVSGLPNE
jgi:hypothetical protein